MRLVSTVFALAASAAAALAGNMPTLYTTDELAPLINKHLHGATVSQISHIVTLDPGKPYVPNLGQLDMGNVGSVISGPLNGSHAPHALIGFEANKGGQTLGFLDVTFATRPNRQYVLDCRETFSAYRLPEMSYRITIDKKATYGGYANPDDKGHFLMLFQTTAIAGFADVHMQQPNGTAMDFYGCVASEYHYR